MTEEMVTYRDATHLKAKAKVKFVLQGYSKDFFKKGDISSRGKEGLKDIAAVENQKRKGLLRLFQCFLVPLT